MSFKNFAICDCSENSVYELLEHPIEEILENCENIDLQNIIKSIYYETELNDSIALLDYCEAYLMLHTLDLIKNCSSVLVFVNKFLNIKPGYDYILLNYLDNRNIMEHGISIRNGWSCNNSYYNDKYVEEVLQWDFLQ